MRTLGALLVAAVVLHAVPSSAQVTAAVVHIDVETRIFRFGAVPPIAHPIRDGLAGLPAAAAALPKGTPVWVYVQPSVVPDLGPSPTARLGQLVRDLTVAGVQVRSAQVLSPRDEAAFTWYAINVERGTLDAPTGILWLDDGRLLFAYVPEVGAHAARPFLAGDREFELYAAGYDGLTELDTRREPACYPVGVLVRQDADLWFEATGSTHACQRAVFTTLARTCKSPPCSLMGTPQPHVTGKFVAMGDFALLAGSAVSAGPLTPDRYLEEARRDCDTPWADRILDPQGFWATPSACHERVMLATVLAHGLGFRGNSRRITMIADRSGLVPPWARGVVAARDNP